MWDKETPVTDDTVVRANIDEHAKEEASAVLKAMGLSVSDALRMMMTVRAADAE